ncbi:SRPBCC family protein [Pararhizobium sp. LjRoot238]|uniref:SRPBCC family protein n=1 Tax=Pararhizobium sp. LjRoot238 TaxID=3342293 RepID=UPI003ECF7D95
MTRVLKITADGARGIVMTRSFDAPGQLVFDAFTKPEQVKRWLKGPDGWEMPVCEIDLRVGGRFRYVWRRNSDGVDMGMGGTYREIDAPRRIVHTELFDEDWTGGEADVTTTFVETAGKTTVTTTILYSSAAARDAVLKSPMESGVAASYDRLEKMLPELNKKAA